MWRSTWRCVIKPAFSFSFLLSINIFVWQNVLYFIDAPRIRLSGSRPHYRNLIKTINNCTEQTRIYQSSFIRLAILRTSYVTVCLISSCLLFLTWWYSESLLCSADLYTASTYKPTAVPNIMPPPQTHKKLTAHFKQYTRFWWLSPGQHVTSSTPIQHHGIVHFEKLTAS